MCGEESLLPLKKKKRTIHELSMMHLEYVCDSLRLYPNFILFTKDNDYRVSYEWSENEFAKLANYMNIYKNNNEMNSVQKIKVAHDSVSGTTLFVDFSQHLPNKGLKYEIDKQSLELEMRNNYLIIFNLESYSKTYLNESEVNNHFYIQKDYDTAILFFDIIKEPCREGYMSYLNDIYSTRITNEEENEKVIRKINSYPKSLICVNEEEIDAEIYYIDSTSKTLLDELDNLYYRNI